MVWHDGYDTVNVNFCIGENIRWAKHGPCFLEWVCDWGNVSRVRLVCCNCGCVMRDRLIGLNVRKDDNLILV